jgi:hypothetical protein
MPLAGRERWEMFCFCFEDVAGKFCLLYSRSNFMLKSVSQG